MIPACPWLQILCIYQLSGLDMSAKSPLIDVLDEQCDMGTLYDSLVRPSKYGKLAVRQVCTGDEVVSHPSVALTVKRRLADVDALSEIKLE